MSLLYFRNEGITLATLKSHAKKDHSLELNIKEKKAIISSPLICEYCSKSYARPQTLRNHIKRHHSDQTQGHVDGNSSLTPATSIDSHVESMQIVFTPPLCDGVQLELELELGGLIAVDPDLGLRIQEFPICQPEES